jgi:hypothetical protein
VQANNQPGETKIVEGEKIQLKQPEKA